MKRTGVINDPLSQTYSLARSDHCFRFILFYKILQKLGQTDGRMTCEKTMIPTGRRDCGLAEWIN